MSELYKFFLASHVVLGLLAVIAYYYVFFHLLRFEADLKPVRKMNLWGLVFLVLSWLSGGYYYVNYYGKAVRDVIKKGSYPWAHTVFMEAKEHIFLFLPFLGVVLLLGLLALQNDQNHDPIFRKSLTILAGTIVALGTVVTVAGAVISGAVRAGP